MPSLEAPSRIFDIVVIGAGPAGLAFAARLKHEGDLLAAQANHSNVNDVDGLSESVNGLNVGHGPHKKLGGYDVVVLDGEGDQWLTRWRRLFRAYDVPWLRSPMFFHLDPAERDDLAHYVDKQGIDESQKRLIVGYHSTMVEDEDKHNFYTPSGKLFDEHCDEVIRKYDLDGHGFIQQEVVSNVKYDEQSKLFTLTTDKTTYHSRAIVDASGPGGLPAHPDLAMVRHHWPTEGVTHAYVLGAHGDIPSPSVAAKIASSGNSPSNSTSIVVVGGGLTAVEIVDMAIKRGVGHVHHLVKDLGHTIKPFDNAIEWIGRYRDRQMATFTRAAVPERVDLMLGARGGGSITPFYAREMIEHEKSGRLTTHLGTEVVDVQAVQVPSPDNVEGSNGGESSEVKYQVKTSPASTQVPPVDHVYFATGPACFENPKTGHRDATKRGEKVLWVPPHLETMQSDYPIDWVAFEAAAIPAINKDMSWDGEVPFYFTGPLGAINIGPTAATLGGAKRGAEWCVASVIKQFDAAKKL